MEVDFCTEKILKKLAGKKDVEDAFQRLEKLTPEEALMAAAETMTVTRDIDDTVKDVDKRLEGVDERAHRVEVNTKRIEDKVDGVDGKVQGVDERVKDVDKRVKDADERVKGVDGRVCSVIQGRLFFPSLHPESVLTLYSVRCTGDRSSDPTGAHSGQRHKP